MTVLSLTAHSAAHPWNGFGAPDAWSDPAVQDPAAFDQLRHQTKNALQRVLCEIVGHAGLQRTPEGRRLCAEVERRILLTATLSDALFGLTREPGPLLARLRSLGETVVDLLGDPDQVIRLDVAAESRCPAALGDAIVRAAHEFLGNAVKHGMHARLVGRIAVNVRDEGRRTTLVVTDDGWGCGEPPARGQGLRIVQALADQHGGTATLRRDGGLTVATLSLPHPVGGRGGPELRPCA